MTEFKLHVSHRGKWVSSLASYYLFVFESLLQNGGNNKVTIFCVAEVSPPAVAFMAW